MAKPLSMDLRERVLATIAGGVSGRQAAERFGVSAASVSRWRMREHFVRVHCKRMRKEAATYAGERATFQPHRRRLSPGGYLAGVGVFGMASRGAQYHGGAVIAGARVHRVGNPQVVERLSHIGQFVGGTRDKALFVQSEQRAGYRCLGGAGLWPSQAANDVARQRPILHAPGGNLLRVLEGWPLLENGQYVPLQRRQRLAHVRQHKPAKFSR